ncbi:DNA double-strand break repair Rad50 ATPase [Bienertia sinuspersici]
MDLQFALLLGTVKGLALLEIRQFSSQNELYITITLTFCFYVKLRLQWIQPRHFCLVPRLRLFWGQLRDFNQVDSIQDKLGGSPFIRDWDAFLAWQMAFDLIHIPFFGRHFTWTNATLDSTFLLERLDKGYLTPEAFAIFPNIHITNFPIAFSDHAPIFVRQQTTIDKKRPPYQIENWCLQTHSVKNIVSLIWNYLLEVHPCSKFLKTIISNLTESENSIQTTDHGPDFLHQRRQVLEDVNLSLSYWHQRVKENWVQRGDSHSKLFFSRMKLRQWKNELHMIKDNNGNWLTNQKLIMDNITQHFSNLFKVGDQDDFINLNKSFVKFSPNTTLTFRNSMKGILCMEEKLVIDSYLGVPIDLEGKKTACFQQMIDSVATRLAAWSNKLIS